MVEKTSSSTHCCKKARAPKKAELSNAVIFGGTWKQIISTLRRGDSKARELAERLEGLATSDVSAIDRPPPAAAGIWGVTFFGALQFSQGRHLARLESFSNATREIFVVQ
jgi:hypothetical protein